MARRSSRLVLFWKLFCYGLGTLVLAFVGVQLWFLAQVLYWGHYEPSTSAFMDRRLEALRARHPKAWLKHQWVPYERISTHLKRAVIAAEDARFLGHEGFDWEAIVQARAKNEQRGKIIAGAPTISQQLAKNLFLSGERSWLRKGQEALITWMIEDVAAESKRRLVAIAPRSADDVRSAGHAVIGFSDAMAEAEHAIKDFLYPRMYRHKRVMHVMREAEGVLRDLFRHFSEHPDDMSEEWRSGLAGADASVRARRVGDFIAGMTDRFALEEHRRFFDSTPELR